MADPATFLRSHSVPGAYFPLRAACLFTDILPIVCILLLNRLCLYPQSCRTENRRIVGKVLRSHTRSTSTTLRSRWALQVCVCVLSLCLLWFFYCLRIFCNLCSEEITCANSASSSHNNWEAIHGHELAASSTWTVNAAESILNFIHRREKLWKYRGTVCSGDLRLCALNMNFHLCCCVYRSRLPRVWTFKHNKKSKNCLLSSVCVVSG